jgi:hypothetical protein
MLMWRCVSKGCVIYVWESWLCGMQMSEVFQRCSISDHAVDEHGNCMLVWMDDQFNPIVDIGN